MKRRPVQMSLVIPFAVIALVFGLLIMQKYRESRDVSSTPSLSDQSSTRKVILFFADEAGNLAREAREMEFCGDMTQCLRNVLDELVGGPVGELDQVLPDGTSLIGVAVEGNTARVDMNAAFALGLSGSREEMLAVYAVVNTVCHNFPMVARVRINVTGDAGEEISMKHLDLREPLEPEWSMEKGAEPREGSGAGEPSREKKGSR